MTSSRSHLVVVANRLPIYQSQEDGKKVWKTSPGGLVSALERVLQGQPVTWVGWTGHPGRPPEPFEHGGVLQHPVHLTDEEIENYYRNFCNRTLWPLYHDAIRSPEFHRHWWYPYVAVNQRFAEHVAGELAPGGKVWVHDYHLQLLPTMLRALRPDARISFFLHIPMPPEELFGQLPWRRQILEGLLGADRIGLQTRLGAQNFVRLAQRYTGASHSGGVLQFESRDVEVKRIPISIDLQRFRTLAEDPDVQRRADELKRNLGETRRILLGVDRLDYTKGIDRRLRAFATLLENRPELADSIVFIQVAVPSRDYVPAYEAIREDIERMVGHINGAHGIPGRVPVHYLYRSLPQEELVSYYLAADVMVVTPLRDGMNLVAKEFVASRLDKRGVLILSEFAGAAWELRQALQVNPHDLDGLAAAFDYALQMGEGEVRRRMTYMQRALEKNDVFRWASKCLEFPAS